MSQNSYRQPKVRLGSIFLAKMRENVHELNRSMESIEKMIEQSRKILQHSREKSLSKTKNLVQEKQTLKINVPFSPRVKVQNCQEQQNLMIASTYGQTSFTTQVNNKVYQAHNRSKTSEINTFGNQTNGKIINTVRQQVKQNHKIQDLKTKIQKCDIEVRMVGAKQTDGIKKYQNTPQKLSKTIKGQPNSPQQTTAYKTQLTRSMKHLAVNHSTAANKGNKIKLKSAKQKTMESASKQAEVSKKEKKQNIRIQEEDQQNQQNVERTIDKSIEQSHRYKTEYKSQTFSDFSLSNYQLESPKITPKEICYKNSKLKTEIAKKENAQDSYRPIRNSEQIRPTPRQHRQMLVRQLQELQTESTTEAQRKAKFILKIKKYGFVEKHLNQSQIWKIYHYLVSNRIAELKWPILIVDEVYKKMKGIN